MDALDKDSLYKEVGRNIRKIRRKQKLTQAQFGKYFDLSRVSIAGIENGSQKPTLHFLWQVMIYFQQVEIGDLLPLKMLNDNQVEVQLDQMSPSTKKFIKSIANKS